MNKKLPWPRYASAAQKLLSLGKIGDVELGRAAYQIEVIDGDESFWPFLQFDLSGRLVDAFCSCSTSDEEGGCLHLAAAYLWLFDADGKPWYSRFEQSLFFAIAQLMGERFGYGDLSLEKRGESYLCNGSIEIQAKEEEIEALLVDHTKLTPETSIKFSNFSSEEIEWWSEGRPSQELSFVLSGWFDLAKWLFLKEEKSSSKVSLDEDEEGFPTIMTFQWEETLLRLYLSKDELALLIPHLDTVDSPLPLIEEPGGAPSSISMEEACLRVEHEQGRDIETGAKKVDGWSYKSGVGFFGRGGEAFFDRPTIPAEEVEEAIDSHRSTMEQFFSIDEKSSPLHYRLWFDDAWHWHFHAYLEEPGDLKGSLFGSWAFKDGTFIRVEGALFPFVEHSLSEQEVSSFVNHHRVWLNSQGGFQTHLASIESHLVFTISDRLTFQSKSHGLEDSSSAHDFGEWVYYQGQGFFSKQHAKLGQVVRQGLEVQLENLSSFIKVNREELELLPDFFTKRLPLTKRGVEVEVISPNRIKLTPTYEGEENLRFFGDFVYIEGEGFCSLPAHFRLPEPLQQERLIEGKELAHFLQETFPLYATHFSKIDRRLQKPHEKAIHIGYLVRSASGLKAELFFQTDQGEINLIEIRDALQKRYSYLFTEAGFLDLREPHFQWMRDLQPAEDGQTVDLSTVDLLRLEATTTLRAPTGDSPQAEISRRLLKELREFSVQESPNLKGLKSTLRLYQQTGLNWLWFLYKNALSALLCDDMGLGKTHQAMALMAAVANQSHFKGMLFLVVCPTSVIYHWQEKLETFLPGFTVHTFHGIRRSLKKLPKEGLILTSYGTFRMEKERLKRIGFEVAVFDEIQVAKNASSQIHKALTSVDAKMKIGLTGTPIENNLRELKALFDIVLPGYMPKEALFREQFIHPIERDLDVEKKALLTAIIRPFILRRRKSEVLDELPEKSEDKAYCDLTKEQALLYKEALDQRSEELISELRDREESIPFMHIFSLLSYLKQICNHPALAQKKIDQYREMSCGKWDLFVELLDEARASGQKVVIFSQYLGMLDIIEAHLKERGWQYAQIRGNTTNRKEQLKSFQEDPNCVVFLGSLQAAGLGIDLTAAQVVFLYDRWWNAARENQAIDRVHRIGQKWGVQVFKLISKGTIEEKIDHMIAKKGRLMEEIVTTEDQGILKRFSRSELIELLSYDLAEGAG